MRNIVFVVAALFLFNAARGNSSDDMSGSTWVATAKGAEVAVYPTIDAVEPSMRLPSPTPTGSSLVFLVDGTDVDADRIPVHLPIRPNGSRGWIVAEDVTLSRNDFRLVIDRSDHTLALEERGDTRWKTDIGVGTDSTPTPGGLFYVKELLEPVDESGLYGPFAYGLSGFTDSPGAVDFNGGEGVLGIHGTNDRSTLGKDVSHGCIRVPNEVIEHLSSILPMGTPVEID